jgi:hypothetical protein
MEVESPFPKDDNKVKTAESRPNRQEDTPAARSSLSSAALTLGIISVVGFCFWYIALPAGVLAIVFGVKSYRKAGRGTAKAGFILGIIGLSVTILAYLATMGAYYLVN